MFNVFEIEFSDDVCSCVENDEEMLKYLFNKSDDGKVVVCDKKMWYDDVMKRMKKFVDDDDDCDYDEELKMIDEVNMKNDCGFVRYECMNGIVLCCFVVRKKLKGLWCMFL